MIQAKSHSTSAAAPILASFEIRGLYVFREILKTNHFPSLQDSSCTPLNVISQSWESFLSQLLTQTIFSRQGHALKLSGRTFQKKKKKKSERLCDTVLFEFVLALSALAHNLPPSRSSFPVSKTVLLTQDVPDQNWDWVAFVTLCRVLEGKVKSASDTKERFFVAQKMHFEASTTASPSETIVCLNCTEQSHFWVPNLEREFLNCCETFSTRYTTFQWLQFWRKTSSDVFNKCEIIIFTEEDATWKVYQNGSATCSLLQRDSCAWCTVLQCRRKKSEVWIYLSSGWAVRTSNQCGSDYDGDRESKTRWAVERGWRGVSFYPTEMLSFHNSRQRTDAFLCIFGSSFWALINFLFCDSTNFCPLETVLPASEQSCGIFSFILQPLSRESDWRSKTIQFLKFLLPKDKEQSMSFA